MSKPRARRRGMPVGRGSRSVTKVSDDHYIDVDPDTPPSHCPPWPVRSSHYSSSSPTHLSRSPRSRLSRAATPSPAPRRSDSKPPAHAHAPASSAVRAPPPDRSHSRFHPPHRRLPIATSHAGRCGRLCPGVRERRNTRRHSCAQPCADAQSMRLRPLRRLHPHRPPRPLPRFGCPTRCAHCHLSAWCEVRGPVPRRCGLSRALAALATTSSR